MTSEEGDLYLMQWDWDYGLAHDREDAERLLRSAAVVEPVFPGMSAHLRWVAWRLGELHRACSQIPQIPDLAHALGYSPDGPCAPIIADWP